MVEPERALTHSNPQARTLLQQGAMNAVALGSRLVLFGAVAGGVALAACGPADGEAGRQSGELTDTPEQIYTVDGWMSLEGAYLPRVCTQENGAADYEALKAQVIAARTYLLRSMRDDPVLGTPNKPVINGQAFQAYSGTANHGCTAATNETRGVVMTWNDELIVASYAAGALVRANGAVGKDPTHTEQFVTYNEGRSGADVAPAPFPIALPSRSDNRGCMGQNRAHWLAEQGYGVDEILRYFYGEDVVFVGGEIGISVSVCDADASERTCTGSLLQWCEDGVPTSFDCGRTGSTCSDASPGEPGQCVPSEAPPASCGTVDYDGVCDGDELVFCNEDGWLERIDCGAQGLRCGDAGTAGNECIPPIEGDCTAGDVAPQCVGTVFVRCAGDTLRYVDCASIGQACGYFEDRVDCFEVATSP